ncbi:cupredoxin domain-containing protein [Arthrobacter sp. UYCu712]|uniref:cupredoxin domain-containing protein n=1 Tax=Arthrobacter sp. UYCu712 TaxID=3156340 RepID=UPI00339B24EB
MKIRSGRAALQLPFLAVFFALILAGTGGCASGGGSPAATSSAPPVATAPASEAATGTPDSTSSAASITIKDFGFGDPISVSPGATVTVTNMDTAEHTVTADQGSAFDVEIQGGGATVTFRAPSAPGTYAFHCTYHPGMHGTLTVK